MKAYSRRLKEERIFQSMSRKGNCYDELKEAIEKYIKYYNEKRIKEKLGWLSPVQYRQFPQMTYN